MVAIGNGTLALPRLALHRETVRHLVGRHPSDESRGACAHTRNKTCTCQPVTGMPGAPRGATRANRPSSVCT
jgi:hypothetical protein